MNALSIVNALNVLVPMGLAITLQLNLTTTRRGGLTFFRVGRFGGSFYVARRAR